MDSDDWKPRGRLWAVVPLAGRQYRFVATAPYVRRAEAESRPAAGELLARSDRDGAESWFVLASSAARLRVNGRPAPLGVRVLADKDEIRLANGPRLYFSTERVAQVVPLPAADRVVSCARCRNPIENGTPAVACPSCGAWCHQSADRSCWCYKEYMHCPLCGHSTEPEAGFRWTPNDP